MLLLFFSSKRSIAIAYLIAFFAAVLSADLTFAQALQATTESVKNKPFSWPLQLEMRVPFEPTAYRSGPDSHLIYELYLTNFGSSPVKINQIVVSSKQSSQVVKAFEDTVLQTMMWPLGLETDDAKQNLTIATGQTSIVFMEVIVSRNERMPAFLTHKLITDQDTLIGANISTVHTRLPILSPPLEGSGWTAADGPGNSEGNHHRRGVLVLGGRSVDSRRFAIDWKKYRNGKSYSGDSRNVHGYYCYGKKVFGVAEGRVIKTNDGLPDNVPGHGESFHPAVPITFETIAGNSIIIDIGNGQYVYYMHLQPGSVLVKPGDHIHKGQLLARIGASGDAREPHLHFEVTTSPTLLMGEGIPYLMDSYKITVPGSKTPEHHVRELPANGQVIDFDKPSS